MNLSDKFFSLFARDFIVFATTLLTGVFIARYLGPEQMGIWTLLMLIPGYAEAFGRLQLDTSSVYFIGSKKAKFGEVAFILHSMSLIVSALIILVGVLNINLLQNLIFNNVETNIQGLIYGIFSIVPLRFIYVNYSYLLIAREEVGPYNRLVIIQAVGTSILSIFMIIFLNLGIWGALIGNVFGLLASIFYGIVRVNMLDKMKPNFNYALILEMIRYSMHVYINNLLGFFQNNIGALMAAIYVSPAQIAFFAMGKAVCEISTRMVPTAVSTILFPRVSSSSKNEESKNLVVRSFRITMIIISMTTLALFLLIKPIVFVLYGTEYYPLIDIFVIIVLSVVMIQSSSVLISYFVGSGNAKILPKITILPLLVQTILSVFLVPEFGIEGAAASYAISSVFLFFFQVVSFIRLTGIDPKSFLIKYEDFRTINSFLLTKLKLYKYG